MAAGTAAEAAREVDFARFGLNRIARGHLAEPPGQALAALAVAGQRLEALLLGAARDQLGDGPPDHRAAGSPERRAVGAAAVAGRAGGERGALGASLVPGEYRRTVRPR